MPGLAVAGRGYVNPACPINWEHPLNKYLFAEYSGLINPGWFGGASVQDVTRRRARGIYTADSNTPLWIGAAPDGQPWMKFVGSSDVVASTNYVDLSSGISSVAVTDTPGFSICGFIRPTTVDNQWHSVTIKNGSGNRQWFIGQNGGFSGTTGGLSFFTNSGGNGEYGTTNALTANRTYFFVVSHLGSGAGGNKMYVWSREDGWLPTQSGSSSPDSTGIDADAGTNPVYLSRYDSSTDRAWPGYIGGMRFFGKGGFSQLDVQRLLYESLAGNPNRFNWLSRRFQYDMGPSASPPPPSIPTLWQLKPNPAPGILWRIHS